MRGFALLLTTTSFLVASPVYAQSKKELAAQSLALSERIDVLESRLLTGDTAAERLMQRMDGLETSVRNLTGEVERLRFERDNLSSENAALQEDLQALQALSDRMEIHLDAVDLVNAEKSSRTTSRTYGGDQTYGGTQTYDGTTYDGTVSSSPSYSPSTTYSTGETTRLSEVPNAPVYREATIGVQQSYTDLSELPASGKQKLAEGDFAGAQTAFKQYLEFQPEAPDIGEVSYWLGETYYVRGGYTDAADSYIASMRKDPTGPKAPEAMIKLAAALNQLGNQEEACQTLASFPAQFPEADEFLRDKVRVENSRAGC